MGIVSDSEKYNKLAAELQNLNPLPHPYALIFSEDHRLVYIMSGSNRTAISQRVQQILKLVELPLFQMLNVGRF